MDINPERGKSKQVMLVARSLFQHMSIILPPPLLLGADHHQLIDPARRDALFEPLRHPRAKMGAKSCLSHSVPRWARGHTFSPPPPLVHLRSQTRQLSTAATAISGAIAPSSFLPSPLSSYTLAPRACLGLWQVDITVHWKCVPYFYHKFSVRCPRLIIFLRKSDPPGIESSAWMYLLPRVRVRCLSHWETAAWRGASVMRNLLLVAHGSVGGYAKVPV